jgi:hypothetical protein
MLTKLQIAIISVAIMAAYIILTADPLEPFTGDR